MNFDVESRTILLTRSGSHAYGTNIESSDEDFKGLCVPPKKYVLSPFFNFEQQERLVSKGHPSDTTIFSLNKFLKLAADCNPNIIEVLYVEPEDVISATPEGRLLIENRDLFLSKKAKFTFSGYAHSQLRRIKSHRSWLMDPPKGKPTRQEFGLNEGHSVSRNDLGAIKALEERGYDLNLQSLLQREKEYDKAMSNWKSYEGWKKNRNPARAELEAKYQFDCKHGSHLIRLSRMAVEILETGTVHTRRPDAEELRAIRLGEWSYDRLVEESEALMAKSEELYKTSPLKKSADIKKIADLGISLHETYWSKN